MRAHRGAVAYCVRADARRSWPSWLALGTLVGLAAGAAMAAAAAGNRTDSAYRDLQAETNAMNGSIVFTCEPTETGCPITVEEVRAVPGIQDAARFVITKAPILDIDGHLVQANEDTCYSGTGEVSILTPIDPEFGTRLHGLRLLEGRRADPTRADEVVMAPLAAEALGVEVGDRLFPRLVDCGTEREEWGAPIPVTVVGIGMSAAEIPPKNGLYVQGIHTTPAFARLLPPSEQAVLAVRLEPGVSFAELAATPGVAPFQVAFDERTIGDPVDQGLRTDANAVWLVAALSAVVSLFVLGPTLSRYRGGTAQVDETLGALGWSRQDRVLRSAAHGVAIGTIAVGAALVAMYVVSYRTPIGDARAIEPSPGAEIDPLVFIIGAAVTLTLVIATLAALAARTPVRRTSVRRTPLAALAARAGLSSSGVMGIRIGLEPGRGQAPVRSSILAVAIAITAVMGVLVYTSSAQHLRQTPAWFGVTWNDFVDVTENPDGVAIAEAAASWDEVDRVSHFVFFLPTLGLGPDRVASHVVGYSTGPNAIVPTVIDGRAPEGDDEILLSPKLADQLDVDLGDRVDAAFDVSEFTGQPGSAAEQFPLEVVGLGPVPVGDGNFTTGSSMTYDGVLTNLPPEMIEGMATGEPRTNFLLIDRADGVTDAQMVDRLAGAGVEFRPDAIDQEVLLENLVSVDRTSTESAPDLLAALMALLAGGVLAYGLATTVHRNERDLAVARALGFTPRLLRRTARWAGLYFAAAAMVVAIPLGLVIGRVVWRTYAEGLGVVSDPTIATGEIVAAALAVLGLAAVVGTLAARWQSRIRPGELLRAE